MATIVAAAGGGNWNATGTWVGSVVPGASDDVQLASSSGSVTINVSSACRSLDCTGYTATLTHSASVTLSVGDSVAGLSNIAMKTVSGMTYTVSSTTTSVLNLISTSATQQDLTTGGKTWPTWTVNGVGSSYKLTDSNTVNAASTVTLTAGTLDTNGQTVSWGKFSSSNSNTRVITLGASAITLTATSGSPWDITTATNATLNANTSSITCSASASGSFAGGGLTYNNVTLTNAAGITMSGANTFANLTVSGTTQANMLLSLAANQTVTGTLTCTGASNPARRTYVTSNTIGTSRTITAAVVSLTDADFQDITGAGAATWSGTRVGDAGGNSGITFDSPLTLYWVAVSGGNWDATTSWSTSTGGSSGARVPLPQDSAVFDASSITSTGRTISTSVTRLAKDIDFTAVLNSPTWSVSAFANVTYRVYGSLTFVSGMTVTATIASAVFSFQGRGTHTLTSAGKTFGSSSVTISSIGGTITFQDDFTLTSSLTLNNGAFVANGNVTCGSFLASNANTRSITMGSGTWTLTGNAATIWNLTTVTGLTFNRGNAIVSSYSGSTGTRTIVHTNTGESSCPSFSITAGSDTVAITTSHFLNLDFTGFSGTLTNSTITLWGNLVLASGMTVGSGTNVLTFSATSGTKTITSNGKTMDFPVTLNGAGGTFQLVGTTTLGSTRTLTLTNGTIDANNQNLSMGLFSSSNSNTRVITMGSGTWTLSGTGTVWTTSTVTGLTINPNTSTIAITDTSASTKTFTGGLGKTYYNFTIAAGTGTSGTVTLTSSNTFNTMTIGQANSIKFTSNASMSVASSLVASGSSGNLVTISATTAGTPFSISKSSGHVENDYMSIQDASFTGGAYWYAGNNSTNVSGNSGIAFYARPAAFGNMMAVMQ